METDSLASLSGGILFVLTQNMEEMEGLGPDSLFYLAKGVRISLGGKDRFRVFRKSPAYHIILDLLLDHFRNHAAYGPIRTVGFGRSWFSQK